MKQLMLWVIFGTILAVGTLSWAQFYQYRDVNGVTMFTDDLSKVPPDQRPGVTTYESVDSAPAPVQKEKVSGRESGEKKIPKSAPGPDDLEEKRVWFVHMEAKLKQERDTLVAFKKTVNTPAKQKEYNERVRTLNQKIKVYKQKLIKFNRSLN